MNCSLWPLLSRTIDIIYSQNLMAFRWIQMDITPWAGGNMLHLYNNAVGLQVLTMIRVRVAMSYALRLFLCQSKKQNGINSMYQRWTIRNKCSKQSPYSAWDILVEHYEQLIQGKMGHPIMLSTFDNGFMNNWLKIFRIRIVDIRKPWIRPWLDWGRSPNHLPCFHNQTSRPAPILGLDLFNTQQVTG